jgi:hypothetical protein
MKFDGYIVRMEKMRSVEYLQGHGGGIRPRLHTGFTWDFLAEYYIHFSSSPWVLYSHQISSSLIWLSLKYFAMSTYNKKVGIAQS